MTIKEFLAKKELSLIEAEILLASVLGKDRSFISAFPETALDLSQLKKLQSYVQRRQQHEPLAYILGYREFYGRNFLVNKDVLIPRPETEDLVEKVLQYSQGRLLSVLDVGTGTGAIAITLKLEQPNLKVIASDIDQQTLRIAQKNAKLHGLEQKVEFVQSDLLEKIKEPVDVIATNLPYVPTEKWKRLPEEIRNFEPRRALDSGTSVMSLYDKLFAQAKSLLTTNGKIFYEVHGEILETDLSKLAVDQSL